MRPLARRAKSPSWRRMARRSKPGTPAADCATGSSFNSFDDGARLGKWTLFRLEILQHRLNEARVAGGTRQVTSARAGVVVRVQRLPRSTRGKHGEIVGSDVDSLRLTRCPVTYGRDLLPGAALSSAFSVLKRRQPYVDVCWLPLRPTKRCNYLIYSCFSTPDGCLSIRPEGSRYARACAIKQIGRAPALEFPAGPPWTTELRCVV